MPAIEAIPMDNQVICYSLNSFFARFIQECILLDIYGFSLSKSLVHQGQVRRGIQSRYVSQSVMPVELFNTLSKFSLAVIPSGNGKYLSSFRDRKFPFLDFITFDLCLGRKSAKLNPRKIFKIWPSGTFQTFASLLECFDITFNACYWDKN